MAAGNTGKALFFPFHGKSWDDPWDIRQETVQALLEGKEPTPFLLMDTIECLEGGMRLTLYYEGKDDFIEKHRNGLIGETKKAIHCVLLRDINGDGMLVHLEGEELLCAYYPVVTLKTAKYEMLLTKKMENLATLAMDTRIDLRRGIKAGNYLLSDLLLDLSKKMLKKIN